MRLAFLVPASVAGARDVQEKLRDRVIRTGSPKWSLVAGVDASSRGDVGRAAIVVMDRELRVVEEAVAEAEIPFPYVPGYLSFREIPVLLAAWRKLRARPDLLGSVDRFVEQSARGWGHSGRPSSRFRNAGASCVGEVYTPG